MDLMEWFGGGSKSVLAQRQLDRIEAKLDRILEHLGLDFDEDAAGLATVSSAVRDLAAQGRKIEAIKLLREETGAGLSEAKAVVDRLA